MAPKDEVVGFVKLKFRADGVRFSDAEMKAPNSIGARMKVQLLRSPPNRAVA